MIIKGHRQINEFLAVPTWRAVLFHGTDMGLAAAYARRFAAENEGSPYGMPYGSPSDTPSDTPPNKPLMVDAEKAEPGDLERALLCVDMFAPPSAVIVKNVANLAERAIQNLLTEKPSEMPLAVIGGRLTPANKLRKFFETSTEFAAVGCYPLEGGMLRLALTEFISANGTANGTHIDEEAVAFLTSSLPEDWSIVEAELNKLLAYVNGGKIDLAAAKDCLGSEKAATLNEFNDALGSGDKKLALGLLDKLLADTEPAAVVRSAGVHFTALARAGLMEKGGTPLKTALMSLEPPIFFPRQAVFIRQLRRLSPSKAAKRAALLLKAEITAKSGKASARAEVLHALLKSAD